MFIGNLRTGYTNPNEAFFQIRLRQNTFGLIVLAHLQTMATRKDPENRLAWKSRVVKSLFDRGLDAERIRQMFRLIDWLMDLPKELETQFRSDLRKFEEER